MRKLFLIPIALSLTFCCSKKNVKIKKTNPVSTISKATNCPAAGTCTIQIIKNKKLIFKYDDLNAMYLQQEDNIGTSIVTYQYNKTVPKDVQDANYREEIQFEISNDDLELNLSNLDLQQTKMVFSRFCFCRGQTGSYKVEDGTLKLSQKNGNLTFNLTFKNNKVPQIIQTITL